MKKLAILILMALGVVALGCGHSNLAPATQTSTGGNWEALLSGGEGNASLLNFVTTFRVTNTNGGSPEPLSITGFGFINLGPCFVTQTTNGSADLTTSTSNEVTGSMTLTVQSANPAGNTLTLNADSAHGGGVQGTANGTTATTLSNGVAWGGWQLTGSQGCQGGGTFVMCQNAPKCTIP